MSGSQEKLNKETAKNIVWAWQWLTDLKNGSLQSKRSGVKQCPPQAGERWASRRTASDAAVGARAMRRQVIAQIRICSFTTQSCQRKPHLGKGAGQAGCATVLTKPGLTTLALCLQPNEITLLVFQEDNTAVISVTPIRHRCVFIVKILFNYTASETYPAALLPGKQVWQIVFIYKNYQKKVHFLSSINMQISN